MCNLNNDDIMAMGSQVKTEMVAPEVSSPHLKL